MLSGEPGWKYCRVHERLRRRAGVVNAFDKELDCWTRGGLDELAGEVSLMPKILSVSRRAESEMTK